MEKNEIQPFRFGVVEETEKDVVIDVNQEDYERDLASGLPEDELLKPGNHKFHRISPERRATKEDLHPSNIKVEFQMKLDLDILRHFQNHAASKEVEVLQLALNQRLRAVMEEEFELAEVENKLLNDKKIIAALAEEVKRAA